MGTDDTAGGITGGRRVVGDLECFAVTPHDLLPSRSDGRFTDLNFFSPAKGTRCGTTR